MADTKASGSFRFTCEVSGTPAGSQAIIDRLRASVPTKGLDDPWIRLADAEAAVHAAADTARSETWDSAQAEIEAISAERDRWKAETKNMRQLERQINAVKVREAADTRTREIVEEIRDGITMIADNEFEEGANAALESALGLISRRFPLNGDNE